MVGSSFTTSCETFSPNVPSCSIILDTSTNGALDSVRITNAFANSGSVSSGTIISIKITNVRNPSTLQRRSGFEVNTLSADGYKINTCSGLTLTIQSAFTQTNQATSTISLISDTAPGRDGTYVFTFETTLPIPEGGSLQLTIPSEVNLPSAGLSSITVSNTSNLSNSLSLSAGTSYRVIVFNNGFNSNYLTGGSKISFTLEYLTNPFKPSGTYSFQLGSYDELGYAIESLNFGLNIEAVTGQLTDIEFVPFDES